jgi:hypothetical protein
MLATRYIVTVCPATPIFYATAKGGITRVKSEACMFDTFEAAMEVASSIKGWGGAARVEQVAVEDTRALLDTAKARIEARNAATCAWHECADCDTVAVRARHAQDTLIAMGLRVGAFVDASASCPVSLAVADHLGNLLDLEFDPMVDGFDYPTSGDDGCDLDEQAAQCEPEPDDAVPCDGCDSTDAIPCGGEDGFAYCAACRAKDAKGAAEPTETIPVNISAKARRALRKWGVAACRTAWHFNHLRGEGTTVCSIQSGIPLRSVDSAINAYREVWQAQFPRI